MKTKKKLVLFVLLLGVSTLTLLKAQTYEKLWKQVTQAEQKSLPQTVISLTSQIYQKATNEKDLPQMLKAYTWRMKYRESLTPDSLFVDLKHLRQWAATAPKPVERAVLHSLTAEIIANYARMNQWKLRHRTNLEDDETPANMSEWSKNQFVNKVLSETQDALSDIPLLLATSTRTYIPFVELGKTSEYYHHDMYHLLASRSITALEHLKGLDDHNRLNQRIDSLYRQMLTAYRQPGDADARVLTTLDYLKWKKSSDTTFRPYRAPKGLIGLTQDPYLAALNKLIAEEGSHDICAEVYLAKAEAAVSDRAQVQALRLCDEAIAKYPRYVRIHALKNLKEEILRPSLTVESLQVVYPGEPFTLKVHHKNLKGFKVNLYRITSGTPPREDQELTPAFLKKKGRLLSTTHYDLQLPDNYQAVDSTFRMQAPSVGLYALQVVPDEKTDALASRFLRVTRFKLLAREVPGGQKELLVLDANSGQPIADVTISVYDRKDSLRLTKTTASNGKVLFPWERADAYLMAAKADDDAIPPFYLYSGGYHYAQQQAPLRHTTLLTDRALYRPGQTVYVKGIVYKQTPDAAQVVADEATLLVLKDANGQEIGRKELRTNPFGSFTADFVLPTVCLNGEFSLSANGDNTYIRVEEYKRPTFDITFAPLKASYRLGDLVQLHGNARTYSGMPLQNLPVRYTLSRTVRSWGRWGIDPTVLASDSVQLTPDGTFTIPVKLTPGTPSPWDEDHYFEYQLSASVTNLAGETQTSVTTLTAGSRSLLLHVDLPDLVCRDHLPQVTFQVSNLDRQPVKATGTYRLYAMQKEVVSPEPLLSGSFSSNVESLFTDWQSLPSGAYQLVASLKDDQGQEVKTEKKMVLFSVADKRPPVYTPSWLYVVNKAFDATHPAEFYFGTSEKDTYVLMDLFSGDKWLESKVLHLSDSLMRFDFPYKDEYGYGLVATFAFVKEGQLYTQEVAMTKRLPDRTLSMKWDVFRDKLRPAQKEEWKLTIRTPQGKAADAEMLAMLYDASLDQIWKRDQRLNVYYQLPLPSLGWRQNYPDRNYWGYWFPERALRVPPFSYDRFVLPPSFDLSPSFDLIESERIMPVTLNSYARSRGAMKKEVAADALQAAVEEMEKVDQASSVDGLRTNFAETAFFYPQLRTNEQGEVSFTFTMPQSLTTWNFRGYAHTKEMMIGHIDTTAVTAKEFMLTPNMPRFVRVGDQTTISATIANLTGKNLDGMVRMLLFDPMTEKTILTEKQPFAVKAGETTGVHFRFTVTAKQTLLACRIIADGGTFSDGEQRLLPVLSDTEQVTETLPLFVSGDTTRTYSLASLFNRHSPTATDRRLTIEMAGNPAWYAVQALPSLAQPQGENAVSWATALYANTLASYIMNRYPQIKNVFHHWKQQGEGKEAFLSRLQQNQEVKNILLQETPWVLDATTEQEQKERLATLFDLNNIANNQRAALSRLRELQLGSGAWSWYHGMGGSRDVTEYIVGLNARLALLAGNPLDAAAADMQQAAFAYLHREALAEYRALKRAGKEGRKPQTLSETALRYMYLIALSGEKVPAANQQAYTYFLSEIEATLATQTELQKAYAVVVLQANRRTKEANDFLASLRQHLVPAGEGLTLTQANPGNNGLTTPVARQVAVMEAFQSLPDAAPLLAKMKIWLLQQKQTRQWNSPVATADAVYALLCQGDNLLDNQGGVRLLFAGKTIDTQAPSATFIPGVQYVKETFTDPKSVNASSLTVEKPTAGIAWGAVYAQYQEKLSRVAQQGNGLRIERQFYVEKRVDNVAQLQPITAATRLVVGDQVVSRITLRLDRPMDFVQLKEQRAACLEPSESLSGYRRSGSAGYYLSVNDASSNLFFDHLVQGVYVLERRYWVTRAGTYETGLATLQSAYAPGFASHTSSAQIKVE